MLIQHLCVLLRLCLLRNLILTLMATFILFLYLRLLKGHGEKQIFRLYVSTTVLKLQVLTEGHLWNMGGAFWLVCALCSGLHRWQ